MAKASFLPQMVLDRFKDSEDIGLSSMQDEADVGLLQSGARYRLPKPRSAKTIIRLQWIVIAFLSITVLLSSFGINKHSFTAVNEFNDHVFSPVQHLLRYRNVVYVAGFGTELSEYQGAPSPENDAAWSDLYNFGISRISKSDAAQLANKTVPIANDPGQYAVSLDVFHQLHCLNMVRKRVWATEVYLPEDELMGIEHIDHCIDTIRQSLMCAVDVTPLPFIWVEEDKSVKEVAAVLHTCRDFDAVKAWAQEHHIHTFDRTQHVHDDLLDE